MRNCKYQVQDPECGWRNCEHRTEGNLEYCASHARTIRKAEETAKRDAEKLAVKLLKQKEKQSEPRKMPNKISEKRKELNKEYFKLVDQFKIDNPKCKAKVNEYCTKETDDPHHQKGRGKYLLDIQTWLPVCRSCHTYIENHPQEAIQKGWSHSRLAIDQTRETI